MGQTRANLRRLLVALRAELDGGTRIADALPPGRRRQGGRLLPREEVGTTTAFHVAVLSLSSRTDPGRARLTAALLLKQNRPRVKALEVYVHAEQL